MKKLITAVTVAAACCASAYAQAPANSEEQVITNTKPQQRAQAKANAKPKTPVKKIGGDELGSQLDDSIGTGKAAAAGQSKTAVRNAKHPNRKMQPQGGTPD